MLLADRLVLTSRKKLSTSLYGITSHKTIAKSQRNRHQNLKCHTEYIFKKLQVLTGTALFNVISKINEKYMTNIDKLLAFICPCIAIYFLVTANEMQRLVFYSFLQTLYMFQAGR